MSIVAISQTLGSLGDQIGRRVAETLSYQFADREIILRAAERYGERTMSLYHLTEEKPTLWERFTQAQHHYRTYVEAIIWEMANRDNVVLVGRGSPFVLRRVRHALRVRITAPETVRATRVQQREGLTIEAAISRVRQDARERASRIKFLYHVDWDDPLLYDLVLNTEHLAVEEAARTVREVLLTERFRANQESLAEVRNQSLTAQAKAALLANPTTRSQPILIACLEGTVTLSGGVDAAQVWEAAEDLVARIPGVSAVRNEITVVGAGEESTPEEELSHGGYRHGAGRSWGGYGDEWYDREWQALQRYRAVRRQSQTAGQHGPGSGGTEVRTA